MEDLLEVWRKEYQRLEELKQTEIIHLQSVKINARALQLKYCIKALKKQLSMHNVVGRSEQFKCDCGCTNHYKNEMYDSVKCADCGTVYARI